MDKTERELRRAVRTTPAVERRRYEEEWRADAAGAAHEGGEVRDVVRGARKMARRRRVLYVERALSGREGGVVATAGWLVIAGLVVSAFLIGSVVLLAALAALVMVLIVFARAGAPSHWSHWLMVACLVVGVACAGFAWWVAGVFIDAADTGAAVPAITSWGGASLIALLCCVIGFVVSVVVALTRETRIARR